MSNDDITIPVVQGETLIYLSDGQEARLMVGTPAWYAWLGSATRFAFRSAFGTFTARKERAGNQRGEWYWRAYRKRGGKLYRSYLGHSAALTSAHLHAIAAKLTAQQEEAGGEPLPYTLQGHSPEPQRLSLLPVQLTSFVGREQEIASISDLLLRDDVRLVTLTGPGGVGKTRVALAVAERAQEHFRDGVCFVALAPVSDPEQVIVTMAQALDVWEAGDRSRLAQLQAALQDRHLLLLLDNFEQVLAAAPLLAHLLTSCPHLSMLITSRAALHLSGEHEFAVSPLAVPALTQLPALVDLAQVATVRLFVERAKAVKADVQLTEGNASTIAEICVRLDGLPLAVELAAARIKLLPPQALLTRLSQRLELLTGGTQDLPARQQTLRNTLQWSYDLLTTEEQRLFRWLSVFVGGCTLDAATAVCHAGSEQPLDVFNGVASLLDKSLLVQMEQQDEEPRLGMLETLREFGLVCLSANGEREAAEQAHARYYLALAEEAEPYLMSPELVQWLDRLEREHENLHAVLQRAMMGGDEQVHLALRLSSALLYFWMKRWYPSEGCGFLEQGLARSQTIPAPLRLQALIADGLLMWFQNDMRGLAQVAEEALMIARALEDQRSLAYALTLQGIDDMVKRSYTKARTHFEEALSLARAQGDRFLIAFVLMSLGSLAMFQREHPRAITFFEESLMLYRAAGDLTFISILLYFLSRAMLRQGEITQARVMVEESLILVRKAGIKWGNAIDLSQLGEIAIEQGEVEKASVFLSESLQLSQERGDRRSMVRTRLLMAGLAVRQGNDALARVHYEVSLAVAIELGLAGFIASGLNGLGCVAAAQGQYTWSALLWGAAENWPVSYSVAIPRTISERMRASARSHLGQAAFTQALEKGRTMTPTQALAAHETQQSEHTSLPAKKPAVAYPDGLTTREVEVLRLMAQGLTNAQIAERLVISPRTVNAHLRSIYNKLAVTSRTAATRYALAHQLI
ncbi:MAG TPA: LuxR C-terminal-related transcriptional regulator [Ktedonobacteraceae bacterium]|nr:LuxR C-terminal-related transcriptional regulator [Ktedonobacteraceae bacterium]